MRIAGVQLADGNRLWADAGRSELRALDRVIVSTCEGEWEGWVFVGPEDMVEPPPGVGGTVTTRLPAERARDVDCGELPGGELPPLGSQMKIRESTGTVVALDHEHGLVTLRTPNGEELVVPSSTPS